METLNKPKFRSASEVADYFGVSPQTVIRACEDGKVPGARKIGARWRIPESYLTDTKPA